MPNIKFKTSEIGEIPNGWEVKKLGEVAEINPREILKKRRIYYFIDMASIPENKRLPETISYKEYKGSGSKFKKMTYCFQE